WALSPPDWSPDGRRIAFGREEERLMVVRADGTLPRRLGPPTLRGRDPHWSPDGGRIAFLEFGEDRPSRFRILDFASSISQVVASAPCSGPKDQSKCSPGLLMAAGSPSWRRGESSARKSFPMTSVRASTSGLSTRSTHAER